MSRVVPLDYVEPPILSPRQSMVHREGAQGIILYLNDRFAKLNPFEGHFHKAMHIDERGSRMIIADDVFERRLLGEGMSSQPARHHRSLDAAGLMAAIRPVARNGQIVEVHVQR